MLRNALEELTFLRAINSPFCRNVTTSTAILAISFQERVRGADRPAREQIERLSDRALDVYSTIRAADLLQWLITRTEMDAAARFMAAMAAISRRS